MIIVVHLTPKAAHNKMEGWGVDVDNQRVLKVKVTSVPEDGKANAALIRLISKSLHLPKSKVTLIRGQTSRIKHLDIEADEETLRILGD